MAKIWPFYFKNMVLTWSFKLVLLESYSIWPGMLHAKFHNSGCIPLSPFPRKGQNMALLWPKDGPHMVLQINSSWIIINVAMEAPCQISQFWVYPIPPFFRNGQNMALSWPIHGPHVFLQIASSSVLINVPRDAPCQISQFWVYPTVPFS